MNYNSFPPSAELNAFIKCYWTLVDEIQSSPEKQRIVPDGCMELIFNYGDPFIQYADDESYIYQPRCFVFGQITRPLDIAPTGITNIFSVRFQPAGFMPFTVLNAESIENTAVPLEIVFGKPGVEMEKQMLTLTETSSKIDCVEKFLISKLKLPATLDHIATKSVELIMKANGQLSVQDLTAHIDINKRQLERRFSKLIGLSPKELSRMIRIQSVIRALMENNYQQLTDVAYESGYFDQAHFINDFREFTGESPGRFFSGNLKMASLFAE